MKATLVETAVRALAATWRFRIEGADALATARACGPILFAPWHEALIPLVWHHRHRGITLVVGRHGDAGLLARAATHLGYGLARGSSSRGGATALRTLIRALASGGDGAITPDGPRGPRHTVKPGILKAAQQAGAMIVPVAAHARFSARLRTWDRMLVPGPGALVTIRYGAGQSVPPTTDPRGEPVTRLKAALDRLAVDA